MLDLIIKGGTVVDGTGAEAFSADIGIKDGLIADVGSIAARAGRVIDAAGLHVSPGFVDIHTHYDGQATWDSQLDPSFSSGVTTAIMGNCGVGFAPVREGSQQELIDLMDGVEEIPGAALSEGLRWDWSSFPEYLDVLDRMPRTFDVGTLVPHGPLRLFVMGERVRDSRCGTAEDVDQMTALLDGALAAGALGMSSSRTTNHRYATGGMTPDFDVEEAELLALARCISARSGYLELAPRGVGGEDPAGLRAEMGIYETLARKTGVSIHLLLLQLNHEPDYWREQVDWAAKLNKAGHEVHCQVGGRAVGVLLGFFGTHPFMDRPSFKALSAIPRSRLLEELRKPDVRARILSEEDPPGSIGRFFNTFWGHTYDLGDPIDYEPDESRAVPRLAAAVGKTPQAFAYDKMISDADSPRLLMAINNYGGRDFEALREMLARAETVLALSDAGAHVMSICDGSLPSFMLSHWARDRHRGEKFPLTEIIRQMTSSPARSIGLSDRGTIERGQRADLNIFDPAVISMQPPRVVYDLPGGAGRLLQQISGFAATIVAGVVTRENDEATGALPGRLIRRARK